jgi:hypothetical protein
MKLRRALSLRARYMQVPLAMALVLLGTCNAQRSSTFDLSGEWSIDVQQDGAPMHSGRVIFNDSIEVYGLPLERRITPGRAYFDLRSLVTGADRSRESIVFGSDPLADRREEVNASIEGDRVDMEVAPQVFDFDAAFSGVFQGDTIAGTWFFISAGDTIAWGGFVMERVARSLATDSAIIRSRRAARAWQ